MINQNCLKYMIESSQSQTRDQQVSVYCSISQVFRSTYFKIINDTTNGILHSYSGNERKFSKMAFLIMRIINYDFQKS